MSRPSSEERLIVDRREFGESKQHILVKKRRAVHSWLIRCRRSVITLRRLMHYDRCNCLSESSLRAQGQTSTFPPEYSTLSLCMKLLWFVWAFALIAYNDLNKSLFTNVIMDACFSVQWLTLINRREEASFGLQVISIPTLFPAPAADNGPCMRH